MVSDLRLTRRDLLKTAAVSVPALALGTQKAAAMSAEGQTEGLGEGPGMNVVLFITDQQRSTMHFPEGWEEANLPGMIRLKANGLNFENAFTNTAMCSPARATLLTGYFPAQHGVKYTLEEDMDNAAMYDQVELPLDLKNIATVMSAAGYNVVYKGKWHLSKPANGTQFVPEDVGQYGFQRWDPPDAGANQDEDQAGGGTTDNDGRFMEDPGDWQTGNEGVLDFLEGEAVSQQPFCLIVSLVNPHDVLFYPKNYINYGYDDSWLVSDPLIDPPSTADEDLSTKPDVQLDFFNALLVGLQPLNTPEKQQDYINFYGRLMMLQDQYLSQILDKLDDLNLTDDTLIIQTSDHGEMGVSHGLRQKNFNFYEESLRVPLIYSNPQLFETAQTSSALVSHVDFLPTIASLFDAPDDARADWEGVDYSNLVLDPSASPVQDYIVFTYDDYQWGQTQPQFYPNPPNHIRSIREDRYKLAEYYDVAGVEDSQWEMYDLEDNNGLETTNLAFNIDEQPTEIQEEYERLKLELSTVEETRLQPLPAPSQNFGSVWARSDQPVLTGQVSRTWVWGPEAFTLPIKEVYAESPGGMREVQYYDKARMEITTPGGDADSIWFVTNGLLVVELISGKLQVGNNAFEDHQPANLNVAGDPDDPTSPTYATFTNLVGKPALPIGSTVTQRLDRAGNVTEDSSLADHNITAGFHDDITNHSLATPFWEFMNSSGLIWNGEDYVEAKLFENPFFATGRPIAEPYWATVRVGGTAKDVLMQCFERRVLTFTPENSSGWQVETGNVGRHYYEWRYA